MKPKKAWILLYILAGVIIFIGAQQKSEDQIHKYVGVKKCKTCHMSKKRGQQYQKWQASAHSQAYDSLATAEAKLIAKKVGLKEDPQKSGECLQCHVAGYSAPDSLKEATYTLQEGVSCEACHGPGSDYRALKTMKAVAAGTLDPKEVGLVRPTEELCVKCHNKKSPTFKEFNFKERSAKIAHPIPKKKE